jgi:sugar phosphate permease
MADTVSELTSDPGFRRARHVAFALSWVAYATYYFGRKGFGVVKQPLRQELGFSEAELGAIDTGFLAAYAIGQFVSGFLGDRVGARRLVGYGMLLSAAACGLFGSSASVLAMVVLFVVNGLAQSSGWPGTTRTIAEWTTPAERGTVMGLWSTCYQVGGLLATFAVGEIAERYGWRASFQSVALLLLGVGGLVLWLLPTRRVALTGDLSDDRVTGAERDPQRDRAERRKAQLAVLRSATLWFYGLSYFFVKLIRYALLFWLPYYLSSAFDYTTSEAARMSTAFDAGGFVGVLLLGRISDRSQRFSRALLTVFWLIAAVFALAAYAWLGSTSALLNALLLALVGALLFGPDAMLSGAAAQDAGGAHAPSLATGFVNGIGSLGALLQGLVVPAIAARFGWPALFPVFVGLALLAVLALLPTLRRPVAH